MKKQRWYFFFCSLLSIAAQLVIVVASRIGTLFNSAGLDTLSTWIVESAPLLLTVFEFFSVFVAAHFLFYFFLYHIYRLAAEQLPRKGKSFIYILLFHGLVFLVLLAINAQLYPRSLFAWAAQPILEQSYSQIKLGILFTLFGLFFLFALWRFAHRIVSISWIRKWPVVAAIASVLFYQIGSSHQPDAAPKTADAEKPHVILIGVDSLRPDLIDEQLTPNLAGFAQEGFLFSNAYTPLGRTFPAWVSILTGKYPTRHGARFNLTSPEQLDLENTLGRDLQEKGYKTAFLMDEKRFANIDHSYGFDIVRGPRIGLSDFLLGSFADFPVLNLLRQFRLGKRLLPDSYDNRAVSNLYEPEKFDQLLDRTLVELESQPFFLAVHFCLPHWPYTWSDIDRYPSPSSPTGFPLEANYLKAIHRADQQVGRLLSQLESRGVLKNAIVVLFSDHPESFYNEPAISAYDSETGGFSLPSSFGHGMSVARPDQSKVVMMIRKYGENRTNAETIAAPANIIDIRPTLLNMLGIEHSDTLDGQPLLPVGHRQALGERPLFFETGLRLSHMKSANIDKARLIKDGIEYYDIEPATGRLVLKAEHYTELLSKKSRAVLHDGWLLSLSLLKDAENNQKERLTLVSLDERLPAGDEANRVINRLLPLLCHHFRDDPSIFRDCSVIVARQGDEFAIH